MSDGVGSITITREDVRNSLDSKTRQAMIETLRAFRENDDVRVVVLRGRGDHFCAGGDVDEFRELDGNAYGLQYLVDSWMDLYEAMLNLGKPTVAEVTGCALGGGLNTLLYTDIVVAATDAELGMPEVELGFLDAVGVSQLPHVIGTRRTLDLMMTGRAISGKEAADLGLATRAVPPTELSSEIESITSTLKSMSSSVLARIKDTVYASAQMSPDAAYEYAKRHQLDDALSNPDFEEGVSAFIDR